MRVRRLAPILLTGLVLAACGTTSAGVVAVRSQENAANVPSVSSTVPDPGTDSTTTEPDSTVPDSTTPDSPDSTSPDNGLPDPATTQGGGPETSSGPPVEQNVIDFGAKKTTRKYDTFLVAAFKDIEQFWATQFPATYGSPFAPLAKGVYAAYPSRTEPIPGCGTRQTLYTDVEGNAFYCSQGDFIVYDDEELLPALVDELGQAAVGVVLAHEFGHAVQERAREFGQPTILKEQQADCFAGAWSAHIARGETDGLTFGDAEIKQGLIAMIQVRDPVDAGGTAGPNAHGTGFDRVGAFQDGFIGGTERCKTFFTEGRENKLINIPFDPRNPTGNLPLEDPSGSDIVSLIPNDLNRFWTATLGAQGVSFTPPTVALFPQKGPFPACDGVADDKFPKNIFLCTSTNQVLVDRDLAEKLDADPVFGDLSVGYLVGDAYSEAVQNALDSKLGGKQRALLNDCFTGAWTANDIPPLPTAREADPKSISLSAGDLDEAVITALNVSDDTADENNRGTAFEKIDAFRSGVLGGFDACKTRLG